ncbi:hypothetical protein ACRAWB_16770 [Leifsonia poae]|uniref:hypothetical protein n=1 Tax=Leifsonia poae TaxID=110933 RepID=UPI003D68249E
MSNSTLNTLIIAFGMLFVVTNSLALGMRVHVGQVLVHFAKNWRFAVVVLLINFVVLPILVVGFAALVDIPPDIKIGYCIVAFAAGAPFAPLLTGLAKGDVATSTTLFVALVVGTVIVVPLALPVTVRAIVPSAADVSAWAVAWPLLAFLAAPLALGCVIRLRYPRISVGAAKWLQWFSIAALLLYVNVFIVGYLQLFGQAWGSGAYIAAFAVPILGILLGSLLSRRDRRRRHAGIITTAQRSVGGAIVVTVFAYTQPLANVSVTIINTVGILILLVFSLEWGRAATGALAKAPAAEPGSPQRKPA